MAESIADETRPCHIYYFGDYDPSGVHIDRDAEKKLRGFAPDTDITFDRVAVTLQQLHDEPDQGSVSITDLHFIAVFLIPGESECSLVERTP